MLGHASCYLRRVYSVGSSGGIGWMPHPGLEGPYWTWSPSERGASITRCSTLRSRRWVGATVFQPRGGWPVICHRLRCVVPRCRAKQTEHPAHALTRHPGRPTPRQGQPATDPRGRCLSHPSPAVKPSGGRGASPCHAVELSHQRWGQAPQQVASAAPPISGRSQIIRHDCPRLTTLGDNSAKKALLVSGRPKKVCQGRAGNLAPGRIRAGSGALCL